jgi:phosphinothricin acetyltransferase
MPTPESLTTPAGRLIDCDEAQHAPAILAILNDAIVHSTALYDYNPRPLSAMGTWFALKRAGGFPVLGWVDEQGELLGFASYGTFRAFPAYKYTVEHSVYVRADQRGRGLGKLLLKALIERAQVESAEGQGVHTLVGCIDAANHASIALHTSLGFSHCGTVKQAGFKFGRWLDAAFYQLILSTPSRPVADAPI